MIFSWHRLNVMVVPLLIMGGAAWAADVSYVDLLKEATNAIEDDYRDHWAFTETMTSSKGTFVGRYDPKLKVGKRWTLSSVDGRKPKAKETKAYLKEKAESEAQSAKDGDSGPASIVEGVKNLRLVKETDEYWLLGFKPKAEGENKKVMKYLDGRVKITKKDRVLESIAIGSTKSFKPNFTTRIYKMNMQFEFGRATDDGPFVPVALAFDINLKTVGVIKVNEKVSMTYSEYGKVID
jgi:hypothetical protein